MDGLSGAASVVGVMSITIQLADGFKKLHDFWSSVQNAPENIQSILKGIKVLSIVLQQIEAHQQLHGPDPTITEILITCNDPLAALTSLIQGFEPDFASHSRRARKWSALKAVFKKEQIQNFQRRIEEAKVTLVLAQQQITLDKIHRSHEYYEQQILMINKGMRNLQLQRDPLTSTARISTKESSLTKHLSVLHSRVIADITRMADSIQNPVYRVGFEMGTNAAFRRIMEATQGTKKPKEDIHLLRFQPRDGNLTAASSVQRIRYCVTDYHTENENPFCKIHFDLKVYHNQISGCPATTEMVSNCRIRPSWWLIKLGLRREFQFAFMKKDSSWQHNIRVFYTVPDDSLIFDYARTGDIRGIQSLLKDGHASVWDTNSRGQTPLHIAAGRCNADLCEILLNSGADPAARCATEYWPTARGMTPLTTCVSEMRIASPSAVLNTLRVLLRKASDIIDEDGLYLLKWVTLEVTGSTSARGYESILKFVFEFLNNNLNTRLGRNDIHAVLLYYCGMKPYVPRDVSIEFVMRLFRGYINAREHLSPCGQHGGYTLLHKSVVYYDTSNITTALVVSGASLHLTGVDYQYSNRCETPTSLAINCSAAFFKWKTALTVAGIDLTQFVQHEMEAGVLKGRGWSTNALSELFSMEFEPLDPGESSLCSYCYSFLGWNSRVEPRWMNMIEGIRLRHVQVSNKPSASSLTSLKEDVHEFGAFLSGDTQSGDEKEPQDNEEGMGSCRADPLPSSDSEEGVGIDYDETSEDGWEESEFLCWYCWEYGPPPSPELGEASDSDQAHETDEDSPFLLPI